MPTMPPVGPGIPGVHHLSMPPAAPMSHIPPYANIQPPSMAPPLVPPPPMMMGSYPGVVPGGQIPMGMNLVAPALGLMPYGAAVNPQVNSVQEQKSGTKFQLFQLVLYNEYL